MRVTMVGEGWKSEDAGPSSPSRQLSGAVCAVCLPSVGFVALFTGNQTFLGLTGPICLTAPRGHPKAL